jgi:hypothetical protein
LEYLVISTYCFPIVIGLALLTQRRLPFGAKILWIYLLFTIVVEIMSVVLATNGINNLWLYRIYLYVEFTFPTILFFNQFSKQRSKRIIVFAFSMAVIFTSFTNFFDDWQSHASIQTGITFAYITFIIISYFIEMFRTEKVFNPFKDIYFVIGAGLLLGHSCTLIYNVLFDHLASGYFGPEVNSILNALNWCLIVFYNLLYSYTLWISRHHQI